jgi:FHS family glucose/mannose:H+ symporter-like MFS transporter
LALPQSAVPQPAIKGTAFVHVDFVLTGVVMTMLGPLLPLLSARWLLNDAQAGYLFIAQFATSMLGMLMSGVLVQRIGYRRTLIAGLILMAAGMVLLGKADWILGLAAVAVYGIGFGMTTPAANLLIANANPDHRASALNLLNSSWGVGAMGCPLLVAAAQRSQAVPAFLYAMAVALLVLAACLGKVRFMADDERARAEPVPAATANVARTHSVPLVAALFFIYVGTENSVGGWVASYARRMDFGSRAFWATTPSFFWGALLVGRVLAPILLRRMKETTVASLGLALAAAGIAMLLAAQTMSAIVVGATMAGLGLASVFPISISMLSRWFGDAATRVSGTVFSGGNLGGAVLPWLVGVLSTHFGGLRVGFLVPLLGSLTMLVVYVMSGGSRRNLLEEA